MCELEQNTSMAAFFIRTNIITYDDCMTDIRENYSLDLGSERAQAAMYCSVMGRLYSDKRQRPRTKNTSAAKLVPEVGREY